MPKGDRPAAFGVIVLGLIATLYFLWLDQNGYFRQAEVRGQVFGRDFAAFWTASFMALSGHASEIFHTTAFMQVLRDTLAPNTAFNPFPYPPNGLLPILPLAFLPYLVSFAVWMGGLMVVYLIIAAQGPKFVVSAAALALAPATLLTIFMGQNGLLTAALFIGGLKLLERAPIFAGVLFGFLAFKPQIGVLIPFALIFAGYWRCFLSAAAVVLATVLWSLWFAGLEAWSAYLHITVPNQKIFLEHGTGFFLNMAPSPFIAARLLGAGADVGYAAQVVTAAGVLVGVWWAFHRDCNRARNRDAQWAVLMVGTFLVSPYVLNYDMTLLSVAVMWLTSRAARRGFMRGERLTLGLIWLLPVLIMYTNVLAFPIGPPILIVGLGYALLGLRDDDKPDLVPELRVKELTRMSDS